MSKIVQTSLDIKDWFKQLSEEVDIWITDPPYPFKNQNGTGRFNHVNGVDNLYTRLEWPDLSGVFQDMYDNTTKGGVAYVFCNRDGLFQTRNLLENAGWKFKNLIVWDKQVMGMGYHWRNQVEYIYYVSKGNTKRYVKNQPNIFSIKRPKASDSIPKIGYNTGGASSKPYKIWDKILSAQLAGNEIIADPFAGTEPMRAAIEMNSDIKSKIKKAYINSFDT